MASHYLKEWAEFPSGAPIRTAIMKKQEDYRIEGRGFWRLALHEADAFDTIKVTDGGESVLCQNRLIKKEDCCI